MTIDVVGFRDDLLAENFDHIRTDDRTTPPGDTTVAKHPRIVIRGRTHRVETTVT